MTHVLQPIHLLVIALAGWLNRHQQAVIDYLIEENCILKEQLEGQWLRFTDEQRMRLAVKAKALGRWLLDELETLVTPDTLLACLRRECPYFLIPLDRLHVLRTVKEWRCYCNRSRPHMSRGPSIPSPPVHLPIRLQPTRHRIAGDQRVSSRSAEDPRPEIPAMKVFNRVINLTMRLYNSLITIFEIAREKFSPTYYTHVGEGEVYTIVDEWCSGFLEGIALAGEAWRPLLDEKPGILRPFQFFATPEG
jgi:hypothetical protein